MQGTGKSGFAASLAAVILLGYSNALDAPCYGYGDIVGEPGAFLEDDYEDLRKNKIGQNGTYLAYVDYLFEGQNNLNFGYRKTGDESWGF